MQPKHVEMKDQTKRRVDPTKRVAEDSGVATNNESANEKPSSRKRSAREIAQLYEQLKRNRLIIVTRHDNLYDIHLTKGSNLSTFGLYRDY